MSERNESQDRRYRLLSRFARAQAVHWKRSFVIGLAITIAAGIGIALLKLDLTFYSIMPKESPAAIDLAAIVDDFPSASTIITVVSGPPESVPKAADAVARAFRNGTYADQLHRVESQFDDSFFLDNGLMLMEAPQLKRLRSLLTTAAARSNNSATGLSLATLDLRKLMRLFSPESYSGFGDGLYYLNEAGDKALVLAQPGFNINDMTVYGKVIPQMEIDAKTAAADNGCEAGLTGFVVVGKDEMETSEQGLEASMAVAILLILILLVAAFRMWSAPVIAGIPLLIGIIWTIGISGYLLGRLNIMTAMYMIALVGLGVDYGIHLLTSYRQFHDDGMSHIDAIVEAVAISGPGVITGAITTAIAFFALVIAESSLVRELGIVAGTGIICELGAMLLLVPALLGRRAERIEKRGEKSKLLERIALPLGAKNAAANDRPPKGIYQVLILVIMAGIAVFFGTYADDVEIETNLMNMEAKGLESVELQDVIVNEFDMASDTISVLARSVEEARLITDAMDELETVAAVESISLYLPSDELQVVREAEIAKIRPVLDRILATEGSPLAPLARALIPLTADPQIGIDDIPEHIRDLYFSEDGSRNLVTIMPAENPWEQENREALMAEVEAALRSLDLSMTEGESGRHATGMVLVADQLTVVAEKDGVTAAIAAVIAIFIVLLIDFRNPVTALLNLIPLGCSFLVLFGIMALTGIKFDFVNIISVPLLIGIGIDDAVHICHRYLQEKNIRRVIRLTGTAVLLTSITTIIGFGSFIPSIMRAMRSTGIVLSVAMALAFVYSVTLHPVLLHLFGERMKIRLGPWFR